MEIRIRDILVTELQPEAQNVLWLKPVEGGFTLYMHRNGEWKPFRIINTMDTPTPDDDIVIDTDNIPTIDNLEEVIKEEVTTQVNEHDKNVKDVHYEESTDSREYPEYILPE